MKVVEYRRKQRATKAFIALFLMSLFWTNIWLSLTKPVLTAWVSMGMMTLGLPVFIGSSWISGRYRQVFDYEETPFAGRQMMGYEVRELLGNISLVGGVVAFLGLSFYVLGQI